MCLNLDGVDPPSPGKDRSRRSIDRVGEWDRAFVVGVFETGRAADPGQALPSLEESPLLEVIVADEELCWHIGIELEDVPECLSPSRMDRRDVAGPNRWRPATG